MINNFQTDLYYFHTRLIPLLQWFQVLSKRAIKAFGRLILFDDDVNMFLIQNETILNCLFAKRESYFDATSF
jgi:hypothetical protein